MLAIWKVAHQRSINANCNRYNVMLAIWKSGSSTLHQRSSTLIAIVITLCLQYEKWLINTHQRYLNAISTLALNRYITLMVNFNQIYMIMYAIPIKGNVAVQIVF